MAGPERKFSNAEILRKVSVAASKGYPPAQLDAFVRRQTGGELRSVQALAEHIASGEKQAPGGYGLLAGVGRSALQGTLFDFADELAGVGAAIVPGGKGYTEARDTFRAKDRAFAESHPVASTAARVGGGLLVPGFGAARAVGAAPTAARTIATGIGIGAGSGALQGAGVSEGDLGETVADAAKGGALGGAFGGVLSGGIYGLSRGVPRIARALKRIAPSEKSIARDADLRVGRALGGTSSALEDVRERIPLVGGDEVLADFSGTAGREVRRARNMDMDFEDVASDFVQARQSGQAGRLTDALEIGFGPSGAKAPTLQREVAEEVGPALKESVASLGKRVYAVLDDAGEIRDPKIVEFLQRSIPEPFFQDFVRRSQNVQRKLASIIERDPDTGRFFVSGKFPTGEALQEVRQELQAKAQQLYKAGDFQAYRDYKTLQTELDDLIEGVIPGFKQANQQYRRANEVVRAYERGTELGKFDKAPRETTRYLRGLLEQAERGDELAQETADAFRMGFLTRLGGDVNAGRASGQGGLVRKLTDMGKDTEELFNTLFPTQLSLDEFMARMQSERRMMRTHSYMGGNSTTAQQAADMADAVVEGGVNQGLWGGGKAAIRGGFANLMQALMGEGSKQAAGRAGSQLLTPAHSPEAARKLEELIQLFRSMESGRRTAGTVAGAAPAGMNQLLFGSE